MNSSKTEVVIKMLNEQYNVNFFRDFFAEKVTIKGTATSFDLVNKISSSVRRIDANFSCSSVQHSTGPVYVTITFDK